MPVEPAGEQPPHSTATKKPPVPRVNRIGLALLLPRNIYWLTHFAGPLFASSWGVVAFMSIWSGRLTEAGAFWGMVTGFGVNVTMNGTEDMRRTLVTEGSSGESTS